jgi:molybdopterin-guanine dinucleotide biosynthesis protein A
MGRDKLSLQVGGVPIIRRVCAALGAVCEEVIVVAGSEEVSGLPDGTKMTRDLRPGSGGSGAGPLAGLEAGLSRARYPAAFVAAGDMPFVSPELASHALRRLRSGGVSAVVPRFEGRWEPLCAAYKGETLGAVSEALDEGVEAMRLFIERLPEVEEIYEEEFRRFGEPELLLMNVNSPEDLARARAAGQSRLG